MRRIAAGWDADVYEAIKLYIKQPMHVTKVIIHWLQIDGSDDICTLVADGFQIDGSWESAMHYEQALAVDEGHKLLRVLDGILILPWALNELTLTIAADEAVQMECRGFVEVKKEYKRNNLMKKV